MRAISCAVVSAGLAAAAFAPSARAQWNDLALDLPNTPVGAPMVPITSPGVTWVGFGIIGMNQVDVDFISIVLTFNAPTFIIDLDLMTPSQDSLLGVGPLNAYPTFTNDNDLDSADDQFAGVGNIPTDSLINYTTDVGPAGMGTTITIGITRDGDTAFAGFDTDMYKMEWRLYVYAVPAPGAGVSVLSAGWLVTRRRRRGI